ncbi:GH1 family beta-glucosidase [Oscillospiraceae bacterium MB08-C2-2]|nr:GH1 family beta-glucosidase [Oscillospiraceae bacterium MB08-C2-2]
MKFPDGFLWGAASAAYQTEGAFREDGKGENIWDVFCRKPGAIRNNDSGNVACCSYQMYERDVRMLKQLGVHAYRFSVSWSRILPEGTGPVNERGLAFYDKLIDLLLANGITPYVTLYHWDLPQALQNQGGWLCRKTADAFAEYAAILAKHFDGRVQNYITLNEPQCFIGLGYGSGIHAPGLTLPIEYQLLCMHHTLLAHGMACRALRSESSGSVRIGVASTGNLCYPAKDTPQRRDAACSATFALREDDWSFTHNWFLDAAVFGRYPESAPEPLAAFAARVPLSDWEVICQPMDFLGINAYNGHEVDEKGRYLPRFIGSPRTAMKWPVTPQVMRYGCLWLYERYKLPLYITENGQSCNDRIFLDGAVHDADRIDFLHRYLLELEQAIQEGVPILGYFHWSLMDNFEWHSGYGERMGLFYTDFHSQRLISKDSAVWYTNLIRQNGIMA